MPIYAYRCEGCGFQKDALQKLSDPPLVDCPECGQPKMVKQVTAAGFALKGTGWYVTDFRDQGKKTAGGSESKPAAPGAGTTAASASSNPDAASATAASMPSPSSAPAAPAAPAATPASSSPSAGPAAPAASSSTSAS